MTSRTLRNARRRSPWLAAAALALATAAALIPATAAAAGSGDENPKPTPEAPDEPSTAATPAGSGLRAFLDPATGEITSEPTRAQVEALEAALKTSLSRSSDGLETFDLATGGRGVHLAGRFRTATVVRRQADGSLALSCVDRPEAVAGAAAAAAPAAPAWEER